MIEWPTQLISDLARRRCVLFLGAGVSKWAVGQGGVRPPSWEEFLDLCVGRAGGPVDHVQELIASKDYLTACELLKDQLADDWVQALNESFLVPQYQPSQMHRTIFKLDARIVLTQNFDKIYDVLATAETNGSTMVKPYYDADTPLVLRRPQRCVIKVHGTIDEPSKMVFTREDYARLRHHHRDFQALVDALFLTHTFLFLGCSLADPDLRLFFEQHASAHPSAPPHFMTVPTGEIRPEVDASIRRNMNLRLLRYSPDDYRRFGSEGGVMVG